MEKVFDTLVVAVVLETWSTEQSYGEGVQGDVVPALHGVKY